jgi:small subunit ribosomal protein S8
MVTDPIADLITRIRNAYLAKLPGTKVPASKLKLNILTVLKKHGYIQDFSEDKDERNHPIILIDLVQGLDRRFVFNRVSKPGQRVYVAAKNIKKVRDGLGISIVSTPAGLMVGGEAYGRNLGGEVLLEVY